MKTFLTTLVLLTLLTGTALGQELASVKFRWAQPDTTTSGAAMADGWMKSYNVYLAAEGDTILYASVGAPTALADSASVVVFLQIGVPSAIQVEGINKWDVVGPKRSLWSDTHIVIPDPPAEPGQPGSFE